MTFDAPAFKCFSNCFFFLKTPEDSTTISIPLSFQGNDPGSLSLNISIFCPGVDKNPSLKKNYTNQFELD